LTISRLLSTLRVRLLLLVLVTAVPGIGLVLYEEFEKWQLATNVSRQQALHLAHEISREHERHIEGARQLLISLAQLPDVRKHQTGSIGPFFADILRQFPIYTNLAAAKPNGEIFLSGLPLEEPLNIADRSYFQQVFRTRDFAVSEYLIGRASGKPNIAIAYPAVDKPGVVQAVVLVGLSLDWINRFLGESQLPKDAVVTLRDHDGMILARYPEPEKWIGKLAADTPVFKAMLSHQGEGTVEAGELDSVRRLYGFTKLRGLAPGRSIYVSVGISTEIVFSEVNQAIYRDFILLGVVVVLSLAGVWFGASHFITHPVNELLGATKRLAAGDLSARTGLPQGEGELSQLARSFDQMAESLEQSITERQRAEEKARRHLTELTALREIDQAIVSTLDLRTVLDRLLQKIDLVLPYAATTVRLLNKKSGLLEPVACRNLDEEEWKAERWRGGRGIPNLVFTTRAHVTIGNVQTDPQNRDQEFFRKHGLISYLGVPLIAKGEILGVISFYTKEEHEFSHEEIDFLSTLAGQAAIAIQNSRLYEEAVTANKVKDEFLSVMSHELRTPLNVVVGYAGMMKDGLLGDLNPRQQEALEKIINRANDQLVLVNNILHATVLESEKARMDMHETDLAGFLNQLKAAYEAPINKAVALNWDYPADLPFIKTDSAKLKLILQNLIDNAIKFTEKGSVTITAAVRDQGTGVSTGRRPPTPGPRFVELKVADTGIGIPKEAMPFIFDKFRQVDSSETRSYGGAGLGLYIVKKFTELLGGSVEVESEPGKGSTFTVMIPVEN